MSGALDREVYSLEEVARMLDISLSTLYRWIRERRFTAYKPGGAQQYRVRKEEVRRLLGCGEEGSTDA